MKRTLKDIEDLCYIVYCRRFGVIAQAIVGWKAICEIIGTKDRKTLREFTDLPIYKYYRTVYTTPGLLIDWIIAHNRIEKYVITQEERQKRSERMRLIRKPGPGRGHKRTGIVTKIEYENFTNELKRQIRRRDNDICQLCGKQKEENKCSMSCHHIDYNKKNSNENNLIALCHSCHTKTNTNRNAWQAILEMINK